MSQIRNDGYYLSEPFHWEDSHAGHKFEGDTFYIIKFENDKCYLNSVKSGEQVSIAEITSNTNYGLYTVKGSVIEILYNPATEFPVKRTFKILSPDILLDEKMREYKFVK
jgi:hypothetical protein